MIKILTIKVKNKVTSIIFFFFLESGSIKPTLNKLLLLESTLLEILTS